MERQREEQFHAVFLCFFRIFDEYNFFWGDIGEQYRILVHRISFNLFQKNILRGDCYETIGRTENT